MKIKLHNFKDRWTKKDGGFEITYRVTDRELTTYIRTLIARGGKQDYVALRDIDMHITKQAWIITALRYMNLIVTRTATRAFTQKQTDFVMLPDGSVISHVMLSPDYYKRAIDIGL